MASVGRLGHGNNGKTCHIESLLLLHCLNSCSTNGESTHACSQLENISIFKHRENDYTQEGRGYAKYIYLGQVTLKLVGFRLNLFRFRIILVC